MNSRLIPSLCDVCNTFPSDVLVPDRFELDDWMLHVFCPRCLDDFLHAFPLNFRSIVGRELTGKYSIARKKMKSVR